MILGQKLEWHGMVSLVIYNYKVQLLIKCWLVSVVRIIFKTLLRSERSMKWNLKVSDLVPSIHNNILNVPSTHAHKINVQMFLCVQSC